MAIPQSEYINIVSSNIGGTEAAERELSGLVFTTTAALTDANVEWNEYSVVDCYDSTEVANLFGSLSREAAFAKNYFAYLSPKATAARKLSLCRIPANDAPADIIGKLDEEDVNFGSFAFIQSDNYTAKQMKDAALKIKELNYKYLFSVAVPTDEGVTAPEVTDDTLLKNTTASSLLEYMAGEEDYASGANGFFLIASGRQTVEEVGKASDSPAISAYMPMALFASTDYNSVNGTKNYMFKKFADEPVAVTTKAQKKKYDAQNINFYGLVQNYGTKRKFLQAGVNLDGEDTACFCNEIWLKSHISTEIFDLMLSLDKIEANDDGESLIYNTICACADLGKTNGTIQPTKEITDNQKTKIYSLTNDASAWQTIFDSGYWLKVEIRPTTVGAHTEYWAYYILVYSKGDSVRKVEGKDFLL